jgi:hypothetical protein
VKPTNLREAEHYRTTWQITLDPSETLHSCLQPDFWAHVARRLRPLSEITVYAHDFSWRAALLVRSATPMTARVVLLSFIDLDAAEAEGRKIAPDASLTTTWKGPSAKHAIVRKSDKAIVEQGFETKADAEARLAELLSNPKQLEQAAA